MWNGFTYQQMVNKYQDKCRGLHEQAAINAPIADSLNRKIVPRLQWKLFNNNNIYLGAHKIKDDQINE